MAKPTWDDTQEIEDIPKFEDTMDVEEIQAQEKEEPSMLESAGRGAVQGATFGLGEEIGSAVLTPLEALRAKISSLIPGSSENVDAMLREQGFGGDIQEKGLVDTYKELRDTTREANKAAEEANPLTYMASDIAGGVIPALATGGGATVAKVGTSLGKEGLGQAAKLGAKYGAVSGLGYGESDLTEGDVLGAAQDVAVGATTGAVAGAALPVAAKALQKGASKLGSGAKNLIEAIVPESEAIKAGYKYGKEGKKLTQEVVDEDMKKFASSVLDKIKSAKNEVDLQGVKQQLDDLGIKVDTKEAFQSAIDDMQKIMNNDVLEISNKDLLPKLQKLAGIDTEALKMASKAEKNAIKKAIEAQSKQEQAIIKGEKKLAEQSIKTGDELQSITDLNRPMDQLDLPLTTPEGRLGGVKGKFIGPEGEDYTKTLVSDTTPYQPKISSTIGPDGRPIVQTKDLGTGKINALVGDIDNKIQKDLGNMTVTEVEGIRNQLNVLTKMAKTQGTESDPVIQRAKQLAVQLRDLTDKAVAKDGPAELAASRKRMSDILSAEDLLGTSKTSAVEAGAKRNEQVRTLADKLGFVKGFKTRDEANEAIEKLGKDIFSEADMSRSDMFKELNSVLGRESQENISRAGLYKKAAGQLPNLAGRAVKKVEDASGRVLSPIVQSKQAINNLSTEQLSNFGTKLSSSKNKGLQDIGNRLLEASQLEGAAKQNLLWSLSQSPAMRELIKRQAGSVEQDEQDIQGYLTPEVKTPEQNGFEEVPYEETNLQVENREPAGLKEDNELLKQREGYAGLIKKESEYSGLSGTPNTRVKGSSDYGLYYDSKGILTSGIGHKVLSEEEATNQMNQSEEEANTRFQQDKLSHDEDANTVMEKMGIDKTKLSEDQIKAISNMVFQLGMTTSMKFKKTLGLVAEGKYQEAAEEAKKSDWYKQTPSRVEDFGNNIIKESQEKPSAVDLNSLLKNYANQEIPADQPIEENTPSEAEISDIEASIDLTNKMQGSGDSTPVDDLEVLLEKINNLNIPEDIIDDLENDAMNMTSYSQGLALKEKLRRLMG